jgi:hypothetical protein
VPAPAPTPTPSPTPEPPVSASCARIGDGSTYTCRDESPEFRGDVADAVTTLQSERRDIFSSNSENLICAGFDGEELTVKTSNLYNEQYKVLTSTGLTNQKYLGTCRPAAALGAPRPPPPRLPGVRFLPATRSPAAGRTASSTGWSPEPSTSC